MNKISSLIGFIALLIFHVGCTSETDFKKGKKILEGQGFTEIVDTGYNFFCCDEKDTFSTGFEAKDSKGNIVKGCFCSTVLKGVTIRFE